MVDDFRSPERKAVPRKTDEEPSFVPPEKIAEQEEFIDMAANDKSKVKSEKTKAKKQFKNPLKPMVEKFKGLPKKQQLLVGAVTLGVIIGAIIGSYSLLHKDKKPAAKPVAKTEQKKKEVPKPTTEASHLTGVQVNPEYNQLPVTGIMIENSPDARPQSGLNQAGVVFEAVAEGGITRFLTLWQEAQPDYVGPVRSVRPYYVDWLEGFDAAIAHVGGSPAGLAKVRSDGVLDLDQFYNGGSYQRVSNRYAPHNVYTSLGSLIALQKSKGKTGSSFTGFARKAEKAVTPATAKTVDFAISAPLYNPHYDYDATTNSYKRSEGGLPHTDERSGQQITPKVVIALIMGQADDPDGVHTAYSTIGSGEMFVFQDGIVTHGTWAKGSSKQQFTFTDDGGAVIKLNPGQTWISIVGATSGVSYAP